MKRLVIARLSISVFGTSGRLGYSTGTKRRSDCTCHALSIVNSFRVQDGGTNIAQVPAYPRFKYAWIRYLERCYLRMILEVRRPEQTVSLRGIWPLTPRKCHMKTPTDSATIGFALGQLGNVGVIFNRPELGLSWPFLALFAFFVFLTNPSFIWIRWASSGEACSLGIFSVYPEYWTTPFRWTGILRVITAEIMIPRY